MLSFSQRQMTARRNWEAALKTYRDALHTYRRLLEMRERDSERLRQACQRRAVQTTQGVPRALQLEGLTPRECEVAALVARGYTNQQIANALVLTAGTVANHVAHVLYKLGATNRTQVAARVLEFAAASSHDGSATDGAVNTPRAALVIVPRRGPPPAPPAEAEEVRAPVVRLSG